MTREYYTTAEHEEYVREAILVERARQDIKWGGTDTDDSRSPAQWRAYLTEHTAKALRTTLASPVSATDRTLQVAALGFAITDVLERERARPHLEDVLTQAGHWADATAPDLHFGYIAWRLIELAKRLSREPTNASHAADIAILLGIWAERRGCNLTQTVAEKLTRNIEGNFDLRTLGYSDQPAVTDAEEEGNGL